ncbi:MAG: hypothetical protein NTZ01_05230 [Verrucomicrobia bacterium]|nr:hypothetical protein [Verrucomicrobiota bacterium]
MSRRGHTKTSPGLILGLVIAFLGLAGVGTFFFQKDADPYRTVEQLKPSDYFENANSLRGNMYQVEGTIFSSLAWNPEKGRLFSLRVTEKEKVWPLPILLPATLRQINIQKNQSYRAKVRVNEVGVLVAEEIRKA